MRGYQREYNVKMANITEIESVKVTLPETVRVFDSKRGFVMVWLEPVRRMGTLYSCGDWSTNQYGVCPRHGDSSNGIHPRFGLHFEPNGIEINDAWVIADFPLP